VSLRARVACRRPGLVDIDGTLLLKPKLWIFLRLLAGGAVYGCAGLPMVAGAAPVSMAEAVAAAWQHTQAGAAAQGLLLRATAERQAADSLLAAPPALELSQRQDRWQSNTGLREHEIGVALPLWLPGQRAARQAAAQAELSLAELSAGGARLRLAGQVRDLAWSLAGLQAEAAAAEAQQRYLQALGDDVARRVRAGDLARSDALAVQGERLAAAAEGLAVAQRLQAERLRWTALTGLAADIEPREAAEPPRDIDPEAHPTLALAAQAAELARRQAELARRDRSEAPELSLSYRSERGARGEASQGSMALALRLPFGAAVRNEPLRAAAQAALDNALAEQARARQELAAEQAIARDALQSASGQLAAQRERVELLRQRLELLDRAFRAGETALPELLLAVQGAAQAEAALARHTAALGAARARLLQVSGLLP
jgi:cobalt-zinc-cadmium efflux system outer membrane protein